MQTTGYAVDGLDSPFHTFQFQRRSVGDTDIQFDIQYCGICHSDIHQVKNEWGNSKYPMVPGHEIIGKVVKVGSKVTKFKVGDTAGVGCFTDSCRECNFCKDGEEQFCVKGASLTYNSFEMDKKTPTFGGYSTQHVVDEKYAVKVSDKFTKLEAVAPLLCAGITTYSPIRHWKVGKGTKAGIVGLGGLGHMGVKYAVSLGAEVTVFSTSPNKEQDAKNLGAHHFVVSKNEDAMKAVKGTFDFILDTVSADHPIPAYVDLLRPYGVLCLVGAPPTPFTMGAFPLILGNKTLAGSTIGGIPETQEMLDYSAEHNITADIELININQIDQAYERTIKGDIKYRFVIDMNSLKSMV